MKKGLLFGFLIVLPLIVVAQTDLVEGFTFDGFERSYRLHLPSNYSEGVQYPLVLNFHGYGSNAAQQEFYSEMNMVADTEGFVVCYPDGINNRWNTGFGGDTDDVAFTSALIDTLVNKYFLDANRVYSTGMSNGGYMSFSLACDLGDKIAAVASVTGSMTEAINAACTPQKPIAVMQIHGTEDATVAYNGSAFAMPIEDVVQFWADNNGCDWMVSDTLLIEDSNPDDGATAQRITFSDCSSNIPVVFYKVIGGAHTWPGAPIEIGVTCQDFEASEAIWAFFSQFSLDNPIAGLPETPDLVVDLRLFPNPAQNWLQIRSSEQIERIQVFNLSGQKVLQKPVASHETLLSIESLPAGLWIVQVQHERGRVSKAFVK